MSHTQLTHGPRGSFRGHAGRVATSALRETIHQQTVQRYWFSELPTWEKTLLAFEPTRRIVPTTRTRITANMTAFSDVLAFGGTEEVLINLAWGSPRD